MARLLSAFALAAALVLPLPLPAQDENEDAGFLAGLIQDQLSDTSRSVRIFGFEGALSSEATIERLTIADVEGVWLEAEDLVLDWDRSALFGGRVEVETLGAGRIAVLRPPVPDPDLDLPEPEATPFSLPDLPISLRVGDFSIDRIELGAPLLGEDIALALTGSANLEGGEGEARIEARRMDGKDGVFRIDGAYANESRVLALDLALDEGPGGIAATLIDVPGAPALSLQVIGTAPIDNYEAEITLASDDAERLGGKVRLETVFEETADRPRRSIDIDVAGDVSALFLPDYRPFFGDRVALRARAETTAAGGIILEGLDLTARTLTLTGAAEIGPDGWPLSLDIDGSLGAEGTRVLLPLAGDRTFVDGVDLSIEYDGNSSDLWDGIFVVRGFERAGTRIGEAVLNGSGEIRSGEGLSIGLFTADLLYQLREVALEDPDLARALDSAISGRLEIVREEGEPLRLPTIALFTEGQEITGTAEIAGLETGFDTALGLEARAADFSRYSGLAGLPLEGSGQIAVTGDIAPLSGIFDLDLRADTTDLAIGNNRVDPLLAGDGFLALTAIRNETGTRIEGLELKTGALEATGSAAIASGEITATLEASLADAGLIDADLSGPAGLTIDATQTGGGTIFYEALLTAPDTRVAIDGRTLRPEDGRLTTATLEARIGDLGRYRGLSGLPLDGAGRVQAEGTYAPETGGFDVVIEAVTRDLALGVDRVDPLLQGEGRLAFRAIRDDASTRVEDFDLRTDAVQASGAAALAEGELTARLRADLADTSLIDAGLSGPAALALDATRGEAGAIVYDALLTAPETRITVEGRTLGPDRGRMTSAEIAANIGDLSRFRGLLGAPVGGAVTLAAEVDVAPEAETYRALVDLDTVSLSVGQPEADLLLRGLGEIDATVSGTFAGQVAIDDLRVAYPNISASGDLRVEEDGSGRTDFDIRLRDAGLFTPDLSGQISVAGTAARTAGGIWQLDTDLAGPGGSQADIAGTIGPEGRLDLDLDGQLPLALLNGRLEPRRLSGQATFDLGVVGPPALSSLNGSIRTAGARLAAPTLGQAIEGLAADIRLSGGRAAIDITGRSSAGGDLSIGGSVGLGGGLDADLSIDLAQLVLRNPALYETTVTGTVGVTGPLSGGARIAGELSLGETNVRVPNTSVGGVAPLIDVTHVAPPADVARTLARAGLGPSGPVEAAPAGGGPAYILDILISAPARIFIRGRGLDAEMGGELRLRGTTSNVIPIGRFSLIRGRLDILQQRFDLTEGFANLQGDFLPFIRLLATTQTDGGTLVSIIVEGPANALDVRFESSPELPQDEVLSQLLFGRNIDSISPLQAVQLASAAATLAGRGGDGVLGRFRETAGLADLDVTSDEEGNVAVRAGAYVSENVYTEVTVGSGTSRIDLNLDVTDNVTARGSVTSDGETSIGIFYERDY